MMHDGASEGPDDTELVLRCQSGDVVAFDQLVTRHRQRAFAMVYQIVRNEEDAWDITQDGFIKAWRSIGTFHRGSSFYTWLYRIMANLGIDAVRKKKVSGSQEFDDAVSPGAVDPAARTVPSAAATPGTGMDARDLGERINQALTELSPEHRAVITLREVEGMDYQEIADALHCSIGTVMSRLFYARKKLQTLLRDVREQL
jgi:RNA polymerase sigma-70 factor (ECF subfamily)